MRERVSVVLWILSNLASAETLRERAHHSPPLYAVLHHQVFGHRRGDLGHMVPVVLFTHAGPAVATYCEAKKLVVWISGLGWWNLDSVGHVGGRVQL